MTIAIVVLTPDRAVSQFIGQRKTSVIPADIRSKPYFTQHQLSIVSYLVDNQTSPSEFSQYILSMPNETIGVMVVCDNRWRILANPSVFHCLHLYLTIPWAEELAELFSSSA